MKPSEFLPSMDGERQTLRFDFLKAAGLKDVVLTPLMGDASRRQYFRLPHGLLMDAPPPLENTGQFEKIASLLEEVGLSVPRIYAADHENGLLWIEDFGDLSYRQALQQGAQESLLYGEMVRALAHLHGHGFQQDDPEITAYDEELFLKNACLFLDWFPRAFPEEAQAEFKEIWRDLYQNQPSLPPTLMLRDVMMDNLLWLPDRAGLNRCGFIDFQDASWGPASYDLVSVLEDVRRGPLPASLVESLIKTYLQIFPDIEEKAFWESYALWGAQRTTRILGVFCRLAERDHKPQYLTYLPRLWQILDSTLRHPSLAKMRRWFEIHGDLP